MQWSLFVLILMGQCFIFKCHLYEYHFIQKEMSWDEARSYCREHFTDLATVSDMRDVERLRNSSQTTDAWIGLHKPWRWSLPGVEYNESEALWDNGEPNDPENCVKMDENDDRKWDVESCTEDNKFICYNETGQHKYSVIDESKNWLQAQSYCREKHTDLVSGLEQIRSEEFTTLIDQSSDEDLWIGLFRDTWSWSDGKNFSFRNWDPDSLEDEGNKHCAMTTKPNGKWSSDICTNQKPFYCYDDKVILIKEKKTWDEALDYCRENYHDLVSITDSHQQKLVEKKAKMADTEFVWLGMRYTCTLDLWFWVSDRLVCYDNWAQEEKIEGCDRATAMKRDGKWYERREGESLNFICAL
ncbi:C-type mannose receptor 2-like [Notothenia coriiceps]|uniref:C-type mannose receptor 2-like n=1 Tax=Notothenia coriiceps TaxID=8208 RepID=A0A6I9MIW9_9TELE|nr:PREDICTED: C-type mannose receptor 2-like [Notothenia coriiceps]